MKKVKRRVFKFNPVILEKTLHIISAVGSGISSEIEIEQLEYEDFLRLHINLLENYLEVISSGLSGFRKIVYAPLRIINEIESISGLAASFELITLAGSNVFELIAAASETEGKKTAGIITVSNIIGFDAVSIKKIANLLDYDYEVAVITESVNGRICAAGFNTPLKEGLVSGLKDAITADEFIKNHLPPEHALHIFREGLLVKSREDLGKLYQFLSLKESIPYCGNVYHERFTELFVDYKHIL